MARTPRQGRSPRSYPWLLPTVIVIAVLVVVGAIVWSIATGQRFV
ncbi:hypothetical protein AS850_05825 [Frondihabitans sp. 762G35]|nr:hypothetical protein [Frondihabitans sp. 762G35]ARC56593.1 hypothetical protein AS850_05825 [Frondihabitans sp. 762G35]